MRHIEVSTHMNQAINAEQEPKPMSQNSLALRLKTETAASHERMHQLMDQAKVFDTLENYKQFTLSQYYFQLEVEHLFEKDHVAALIPDLDIRGRSEQAKLDLADLNVQPQGFSLYGQNLVSQNVIFLRLWAGSMYLRAQLWVRLFFLNKHKNSLDSVLNMVRAI